MAACGKDQFTSHVQSPANLSSLTQKRCRCSAGSKRKIAFVNYYFLFFLIQSSMVMLIEIQGGYGSGWQVPIGDDSLRERGQPFVDVAIMTHPKILFSEAMA
jgi:hypothetical protein